MARKLATAGIQTTLITDSAIFAMMARANKVWQLQARPHSSHVRQVFGGGDTSREGCGAAAHLAVSSLVAGAGHLAVGLYRHAAPRQSPSYQALLAP